MITDEVHEKIKQFPESPGIYKMLDANRTIIYIGKSKCLKKRVNSYFVSEPNWEKAKKMAKYIHDVEYIVTDTHLDAMLLECEMIKKLRPYFNVLMKYEQKYVYLVLEKNYRKNPLGISYVKTDNAIVLLRSRSRLEEFIDGMRHLYPLEKQKNGAYHFHYDFMPLQMSEKEFEENRRILAEICQDSCSMEVFISQLEKAMKREARQQNYEYAAKYRDLINSSQYLENHLHTYQELKRNDILYTVSLSDGYKLYYIRNGLVIQSQIITKDLEQQKDQFVKNISNQKIITNPSYSEKESIDYRSILYTELASADKNTISYIHEL